MKASKKKFLRIGPYTSTNTIEHALNSLGLIERAGARESFEDVD